MTIGLSIFLLGAEPSIIFKNPTTNFGSSEKHEKVKSSSPPQQKKKKENTWTRLARSDRVGNNQKNTKTIGGGKWIFSEVGDLFELPCKKKQVLRDDEVLSFPLVEAGNQLRQESQIS